MRLGEIINCKWNWINLTERTITVMNDDLFTTKSKLERTIPISESLYSLLLQIKPKVIHLDGSNYVFQKCKGIKLKGDYVSKHFKDCIREAGLNPKYHFHNLRSSFASNLLRSGISILYVQKLLGHSSSVVTEKHYSNIDIATLREAVNCLN
jgi:integrase/recombinase XerD